MNYLRKPRLQHIALVKIAATLWNQDDVKDLFAKFSIPSIHEKLSKWVKIETIVVEKVAKLPLPKSMEKKLLCLIRPVGFQISKWRQFHYNIGVDLPKEFSWTPQGRIDETKTAETMIKDQSIDITKRYKLACIYCLEDDIKKLWEEIPEECRKSFYSPEDPTHVMQTKLVVFWTYHIKGEVDKMESMIEKRIGHRSHYYYAYSLAISDDNRVAAEYFYKLTRKEMEGSVNTIGAFRRREMMIEMMNELNEMGNELNENSTILEKFLKRPHLVVLCLLVLVTTLIFILVRYRICYPESLGSGAFWIRGFSVIRNTTTNILKCT